MSKSSYSEQLQRLHVVCILCMSLGGYLICGWGGVLVGLGVSLLVEFHKG